MADDLGSQLQVQQQINKVLAQRDALLKRQTTVLGGQVKIAAELCNALDCKQLDGMSDRLQEINESLKEVAGSAGEAASATESMGASAGSASGGLGGIVSKLPLLGGAAGLFGGIGSAIGGAWSMVKGFGKGIVSIAGTLFNLGKTILSIPFKIFDGLIGMAQQGGGGAPVIRQAFEELRKEFGALAAKGGILRDILPSVRKQMHNLAGTGLSVRRVFGMGRAGIAEAIKYAGETAKAMGSAFSALKEDFAKNAVAIGMFRKGLGFTAEQMAALSRRALASGRTISEVATEIASYAIKMGKQFGISSKLISKDMGVMMEDFEHFGTLGPKVMSQVSVFTRKLGIEIKGLTGLIDGFDNFEDAAKGASQLAQSFGMNVDAMKMMKEQDPGKRLSMLQKAFAATGKSVENMDRVELKLLATQSKLSMEDAKRAFSQQGLGMSYDKIVKGGDKAKKKQLTQAQAMTKLAKTIERVFGSGSSKKFKGFWDAFSSGFARGLKRSSAFRKVMRNIRRSLKIMHRAGIKVGKAFVKFFPGVKKLLGGLAKLFDPKSFKKLANGMVKAFTQLFKDLKHDPKAGVARFVEKIKEIFGSFFAGKSGAVQMIKDGAKMLLKTFSSLFALLIPYIKDGIQTAIESLTEFIKDPSAFLDSAANAGGFIAELFSPILEAITAGESSTTGVWGAFNELFTTIWEKIKVPVMDAIKTFGEYVLYAAIAAMVVSVVKGILVGVAGKLILGMFGKLFKMMPAVPKAAVPPKEGGEALYNFVKQFRKITKKDIKGLLWKLPALAIIFGIGMIAFAGAIWVVAKIMSTIRWQDLIKALASMVTMTGLALAVGLAAIPLSKLPPATMMAGAKVIGVSGLIVAALGVMGALIAEAWSGVEITAAQVGNMLLTTTVLLSLTSLTALGAEVLGGSAAGLPLMLAGLKVIAVSGLIVTAIAAIAGLLVTQMPSTSVEKFNTMAIFLPILFGVIGAVTWGSMAIGTAMAATAGIGFGAILIGLGVIATVAAAVALVAAGFVIAFRGFSKSALEKAKLASIVALNVVAAVTMAMGAALSAGFGAMLGAIVGFFTGSNPFEKGMKSLEEAARIMLKYIPPIMKGMVGAVKGAKPKEVESAVKLLKSIMEALMPMVEAQKAAIALSIALPNADPEKLTKMFKAMTEFATGPLKELNVFVDKISEVASGMSQSKLKGVQAIAIVLSSAATFIGAVSGPITMLINAAVEKRTRSGSKEGGFLSNATKYKAEIAKLNSNDLKVGLDVLADKMPGIIESLSGSVGLILDEILASKPFSEADAAKITEWAKVAGPAMKSIGTIFKAVGEMLSIFGKDVERVGRGAGNSHDSIIAGHQIAKKMAGMNRVLFGHTQTLTSTYKKTDGTVDPVKQFERQGLIGMIMGWIQGLSKIDVTDLDTSSTGAIQTLSKSMSGVTTIVGGINSLLKGSFQAFGKNKDADPQQAAVVARSVAQAQDLLTGGLVKSLNGLSGAVFKIMRENPELGKLKGTEANKLKNIGKIIGIFGPIMEMIGSIALMFKPSDKPIPSGTKAKLIGDRAKRAGDFIKTSMDALGEGLKTLVEKLLGTGGIFEHTALSTSSKRKALIYKANALKAVFGIVTTLIGVIGEIAGINKNGSAGGNVIELGGVNYTLFGGAMIQLNDTLGGDSLKGIMKKLPALVADANKIPLLKKGIAKNITSVGEIITAFADVGPTLKCLTIVPAAVWNTAWLELRMIAANYILLGAVLAKVKAVKNWKTINSITEVIKTISTSDLDATKITNVATALAGKDPKSAYAMIKSLKTIAGAAYGTLNISKSVGYINALVKTLASASRSGLDTGTIDDFGLSLTTFSNLLKDPNLELAKKKSSPLDNLVTNMGRVQEIMTTTSSAAGFHEQALSIMSQELSNFNTILADPDFLLSNVQPDALSNLIANMALADDAITTGVRVSTKTSALFKGGKLEVTHNMQNANITVQVNLSSRDLAHGVSKVKFSPHGKGHAATHKITSAPALAKQVPGQ